MSIRGGCDLRSSGYDDGCGLILETVLCGAHIPRGPASSKLQMAIYWCTFRALLVSRRDKKQFKVWAIGESGISEGRLADNI